MPDGGPMIWWISFFGQFRDRRFPVIIDSNVPADKVMQRFSCSSEEMQAVQANEIYSYSRRGNKERNSLWIT